jgi:hypothetical protein
MEPIAWGNATLLDVSPAQNLLAHQGHHYGMIYVMVGCITIGNILQSEAPNESNDIRIGWFEDAIDLAVHISKLSTNAWMTICVGLNMIASRIRKCYSGSSMLSRTLGVDSAVGKTRKSRPA